MRIGEAFALRWGDVDFNRRFIHVQRGSPGKRLKHPRTGRLGGGHEPTSCGNTCCYRTECRKKGFALGLGDAPEYIFTNEKGGSSPWTTGAKGCSGRLWKGRTEKDPGSRSSPHLRHTPDLKGRQHNRRFKPVGHYSVKLTLDVYNHWLPEGAKIRLTVWIVLELINRNRRYRMKIDFFCTLLHPRCTQNKKGVRPFDITP